MQRAGLVLAGAFLLNGCITYAVDESWFFKPEPIEHKATRESELVLDRQERLTQRGEFSDNIARVFPNFPDRIPARITHFFVPLGGERIAMTRVAGANGSEDEPLIVYCGGQSGTRRNIGGSVITRVPTAAERAGDFSAVEVAEKAPVKGVLVGAEGRRVRTE